MGELVEGLDQIMPILQHVEGMWLNVWISWAQTEPLKYQACHFQTNLFSSHHDTLHDTLVPAYSSLQFFYSLTSEEKLC